VFLTSCLYPLIIRYRLQDRHDKIHFLRDPGLAKTSNGSGGEMDRRLSDGPRDLCLCTIKAEGGR